MKGASTSAPAFLFARVFAAEGVSVAADPWSAGLAARRSVAVLGRSWFITSAPGEDG
jgi:hypothetical protein